MRLNSPTDIFKLLQQKNIFHIMINILSLLALSSNIFALNTNNINIWKGHSKNLSNWQTKSFKGNTQYNKITYQGKTAIQAISHSSASGLYKTIEVNIQKYPYLNWSWAVSTNISNNLKETEKVGDDFSARIYVIASTGFFFWNKVVICYVWASHQKINQSWPNPFTGDSVKMYVVSSSRNNKLDTWYTEKRNVYQDFKNLFDIKINEIQSIAIMTDTDNTHSTAIAYYGNIYFSQ